MDSIIRLLNCQLGQIVIAGTKGLMRISKCKAGYIYSFYSLGGKWEWIVGSITYVNMLEYVGDVQHDAVLSEF